jgi:SnoaL-like domain
MATWLLVHSPLLGPRSWAGVAAELSSAGHRVYVPDLRPALSRGAGYAIRQARFAAGVAPPEPVLLAGHSGAGPLLPAVTTALEARSVAVERCVFVDAGQPHPGRSRRSTFPKDLVDHLEALTSDGWLPPWPEWWPAEALTELLPEPGLRAALRNDCPRLPAALFDEPLPDDSELAPAAYVQLSGAYGEPAACAETAGWPVLRLDADHLAPLTRPHLVAQAMVQVAGLTSAVSNAARRHVNAFNRAVSEGDWTSFAAGFAEHATMRFTNVPVGPFAGRETIERGYREQPPDDTMTIQSVREVAADAAEVGFTWDAGGAGTMLLRWADGLVAELVITFD